ncbi:hypothetical protein NDU88_002983 [Pleurodeles waltl]|uniref:Uncharacterized protein n=1 Tax=Pleurodeles waltl TaxID=8319 RepID=A0AAV7L0K5_PLEWA|nr:hypothetical protein NDU88_002983 [Pleurodeles waltl]
MKPEQTNTLEGYPGPQKDIYQCSTVVRMDMPLDCLSPTDRSNVEESRWPIQGDGVTSVEQEDSGICSVEKEEGSIGGAGKENRKVNSVEENPGQRSQGTPVTTRSVVGVQEGATRSRDSKEACMSEDLSGSWASRHIPGGTWLDKVRTRVCGHWGWGSAGGVSELRQ